MEILVWIRVFSICDVVVVLFRVFDGFCYY